MKFWECDFNHLPHGPSRINPGFSQHPFIHGCQGFSHINRCDLSPCHRARGGCTTGCDPKVKRVVFPAARGVLGAIGVAVTSISLRLRQPSNEIYIGYLFSWTTSPSIFLLGILLVRTLAPAFVDIPQHIHIHIHIL